MLTYGSKTLINDQKECCNTFSFQNLSNHENHEVHDKLELYVCKDWKKKIWLEICTYHALVSHLGPLNLGSAHQPQSGDSMQKLQSSEVLWVQEFFRTVSVICRSKGCWAFRPIKAISRRSNALCMFSGQLWTLKCLVFCSFWTNATLLISKRVLHYIWILRPKSLRSCWVESPYSIAQFSHCNLRQDGWVFETKRGC